MLSQTRMMTSIFLTLLISRVTCRPLEDSRLEEKTAKLKFISSTLKFYREALEELNMIQEELLQFTIEAPREEEEDIRKEEEDLIEEFLNDTVQVSQIESNLVDSNEITSDYK